ncbi:hypothetical protein [Rhizobium laguerreae]|uniref:hypothetical protein n=1 Tax=Rhizobium laguerreae TaxID=1076926 RepID=UPI0021B0DA03|nr:hypothetical protein [Rhizobium laguerreae]
MFISTSIFAFDFDDRSQPVRAWETVFDGEVSEAVEEAKEATRSHAGGLVVKREERPVEGDEGDPLKLFQASCPVGPANLAGSWSVVVSRVRIEFRASRRPELPTR